MTKMFYILSIVARSVIGRAFLLLNLVEEVVFMKVV